MDWSKLNPYKNEKGSRDRFYDKTGIAKHREWRGFKDTIYDFHQWLGNLAIMGGFMAQSPLRIARGLFEYRWFGSYLGAFHWIDKCMEGLEGEALRLAHMQMHAIMKMSTDILAKMMKGDRRFGDTPFADKQVIFEQTMGPEILAGFPNLEPMCLEAVQGLIGSYMDQNLPVQYIDAIEKFGLPSDSCRLSATTEGIAILDDFPHGGSCMVINNAPCDSSTMNSQMVRRRFDLPETVCSLPMRWEDESTDKYAGQMMQKTIDFVSEVTGETWDEKAFMDMMELHNKEVMMEREQWEYMRTQYNPYGGSIVNLFHTAMYAFSGGRLPGVSKALEKSLKIAEKCYKEKINPWPKSRHRAIIWAGPGCYFFHFANWLYNCWGIQVIAQMDNFEGNVLIPTDSHENALIGVAKNYENGIMRRHLTGGWQHLLEFWNWAEYMNCDLVIMNEDITCKGALGLDGIAQESAKQHPNIKMMKVSNDLFDHRTISRNDMRKEVNTFMMTVMQEEPLDATLLDFDDYEGW